MLRTAILVSPFINIYFALLQTDLIICATDYYELCGLTVMGMFSTLVCLFAYVSCLTKLQGKVIR